MGGHSSILGPWIILDMFGDGVLIAVVLYWDTDWKLMTSRVQDSEIQGLSNEDTYGFLVRGLP